MAIFNKYQEQNRQVSAVTHWEYDKTILELQKVRDCVEGSPQIKRLGYTYLPHPSQIDKESPQARQRYIEYKTGAEFDEYPSKTLKSMLGKMRIHNLECELPSQIEYLKNNIDGDGTSLQASVEYCASNNIQMKWQVLVADYQGLGDVDLSSVTLAESAEMMPQATIKQYVRENVVNWHFDRVNGVMQLAWIMLLERGSEFNQETYSHDQLESYLILALDENGDYYQQKIVYGSGETRKGERSYVTINGKTLKTLPVVVVSDEEKPPASLPSQVGFLHGICESTLHKYNVSAVYKETQRNLSPTVNTTGWTDHSFELFSKINGRDHILTGGVSVNNLPDGVSVDVMSVEMSMSDFQWYFDKSDKKIRMMGGANNVDAGIQTATEADINAAEQNAMLETLVNNLEDGWKMAIAYCGMFEGLWLESDIEKNLENIKMKLPKDFASPKLSVEEVGKILEMYQSGLRTESQVVKQLAQGGWDYQDAETTIAELEGGGDFNRSGDLSDL